jgi:hypothetical protein
MLRSIISYLSFCGRTLREDYQNWKWRRVTDTTLNFARKINNILVAVAAAGIIFFALRFVYQSIWPLLGIRWWVIVALSLAVIFLVYLTTAIRRSRERIMLKIEANYNEAICQWEKCVFNSADFSSVVSSARELFFHLNGGSGESDEHMIQRWSGDAERVLENRSGREAVIELRGGSNVPLPIPASHHDRVKFLNRYAMKFGDLVAENRRPKAPYDIVRI